MLRLQRYDLQVEYEPGKNMFIADTLKSCSRSKQWNYSQQKGWIWGTLENLPVSEVKLEQFKDVTRKDLTLQKQKWMARKEVLSRPRALWVLEH